LSVFCFIDRVEDVHSDGSLTAYYTLTGREEFLLDHFGGFPVMPGVLMLEALKQASRRYLELSEGPDTNWRLSSAEEVKFGQFVRPGGTLRIKTKLVKKEGASRRFDGRIELLSSAPDQTSVGRALAAAITLSSTN
jgi:3-hydroxyacyl-[acyl-carrier-protein] dehydratase